MRRLLLLSALALTLGGCVSESRLERIYVHESLASEERPATYLGLPLKTGQIILGEAGNPYSTLFSLCTESYFDFTHAGVIVMEEGKPFVYEMSGEYVPGFDDRPTDGIEGGCQRVDLESYAKAYLYLEVFDPPEGVDGDKVGAWAQARMADDTPFDPYFNYSDHESLFCTEFVALALEAGGAPPTRLAKVTQHPGLRRLLQWLRADYDEGLPAGTFVDRARRIGALGQLPSMGAAQGYFAAKRELHRRFTTDQQLGNVFSMNSFSELNLRLQILHFISRGASLIHDLEEPVSDERAQELVRELATEMFGVAEPSGVR